MSSYIDPDIMEIRNIISLEDQSKYSRTEKVGKGSHIESIKASPTIIKCMGAGN